MHETVLFQRVYREKNGSDLTVVVWLHYCAVLEAWLKKSRLTNMIIIESFLQKSSRMNLPFIVTNEGFYSYLKSDSKRRFINLLFSGCRETLPFDFKITKTTNTFRKLSLIHPFGQSRFVDFYRRYNGLIKSKCDSSKFSLRYPVDIALFYIERDEKELESEVER